MSKIRIIPLTKDSLSLHMDQLLDLDKEDFALDPWNRDKFCLDLAGKWELSYLALSDNKVVGYVIHSMKPREMYFEGSEGKIVYGHRIVVKKNFRGKGIGSSLIRKSIETISKKGFKEILGKCPCDDRVVKFYTASGYKIVKKIHDVDGVDRYLLKLEW